MITATIVAVALLLISDRTDCAAVQQEDSNFVGEVTNDLAIKLLEGFAEQDKNIVFSPLGYSTVLAILCEGARGNTRNQLVSFLHLPEDIYAARNTYKNILEGMKEKWILNRPEFKNWFYVYKNYTIDENFKHILADNYLTEVRSVDRVHNELSFDLDDSTEIKPVPAKENKILDNKKNDDNKKEISKENDDDDNFEEENEPQTSVKKNNDFSNILSTNEIIGRNSSDSGINPNSKMIAFNGLFFRGSWAIPFIKLNEKEKVKFYITQDNQIPVESLQARGEFYFGEISELDCKAIDIPYKGGHYSLLILLPQSRNGLAKLVSDLAGFSLKKIYNELDMLPAEVYLPTFNFQTISDPKNVLEKSGVTDIFSEKADLSGITLEQIKLGELIQMVTLHVDEGNSEANFLTATDISTRADFNVFKAEHPFLFFIRDISKNVIVVAGKVTNPTHDNNDFER